MDKIIISVNTKEFQAVQQGIFGSRNWTHSLIQSFGNLLKIDQNIVEDLQQRGRVENAVTEIFRLWVIANEPNATLESITGLLENTDWNIVAEQIVDVFLNQQMYPPMTKLVPRFSKSLKTKCLLIEAKTALDTIRGGEPFSVELVCPQKTRYSFPYKMNETPKGHVFLLSISEFDDETLTARTNTESDIEKLSKLWTQLGFELHCYKRGKRHWTKAKVVRQLDMFHFWCRRLSPKSIVIYIASYGRPGTILTSDKSSSGEQMSLDIKEDVVARFAIARCYNLSYRPKNFIFETNEVPKTSQMEQYNREYVPTLDTIICTAHLKTDMKMNNNGNGGSLFVQCFTYVVMKYAYKRKVHELFFIVGEVMARILGKGEFDDWPVVTGFEIAEFSLSLKPREPRAL